MAMSSHKPRIGREERYAERFSEGDVRSVVWREHGSQAPDPIEQSGHRIAGDAHVTEVGERVLGLPTRYPRTREKLAKSGDNLEVDQVGSGEIRFRENARSDPVAAKTTVYEIVDRCRRVEDDQ
jgi:hypothetical protein